MFILVDIGFFTIVLLFVGLKWIINTSEMTKPIKSSIDDPSTYSSEYSSLTLNGKSDDTVLSIHAKEMELQASQAEFDYRLQMESMKRQQDTEIVQWGLLTSVVMMYLITRLSWMKGKKS